MKIAVVGGNLTGTACARYLERSWEERREEYDKLVKAQTDSSGVLPAPPKKYEVTIFDKKSQLGGYKFETASVEGVDVEVGRQTVLHSDAVFLNSVVDDVKSEVTKDRFWQHGTSNRTVRSFAVYDSMKEGYSIRHGGYYLLDLIIWICSFALVRLAFGAVFGYLLWYSTTMLLGLPRVKVAGASIIMALYLVLFPYTLLSKMNRFAASWTSTMTGLLSYGMTVATARGAVKGFVKHFQYLFAVNAATKSITVGHLLSRCGLGTYSKTDGETSCRSFNFYPEYVRHYADSQIKADYADSKLASRDLSTLAALLCLARSDVMEEEKIFRVEGGNALLCVALARGARQMLNTTVVHVGMNSKAERDGGKRMYTITYMIPASAEPVQEDFDGIVLGCAPEPAEVKFDVTGLDPELMFGEVRDRRASTGASGAAGASSSKSKKKSASEPDNKASWLAVVAGTVNHKYFGHLFAYTIPDLILADSEKGWMRLECVAESPYGKIWTLLCSQEPKAGEGIVGDLFTEVRQIRARRRVPAPYACTALVHGATADDIPTLVLGNRFIYAGSLDRLASDPETDVIAAKNAASLFSAGVDWKDDEVDEEPEATVDDENTG